MRWRDRNWIGTKERLNHLLFFTLPIAAALNPINPIAEEECVPAVPHSRASERRPPGAGGANDESTTFLPTSVPSSVRVSEDHGTAYQPLFGSL